MALHQSRSLKESLNHVARPVWVHSSLFSCAGQNGELFAVDCVVLCAHCDLVRNAEDVGPPADGQGMPARHVQTLYP